MKQLLPREAALAALLQLAAAAASAQPVMQQWPAANAPAAAPTTVQVQFEVTPAASPLWVYSAQRGGLRTGHSGQLLATDRLLTFRPAYPFQPGEVVYATTWAASAANQPERPQQWQFTAAVGGTGQGNFLPGAVLPTPNPAPGIVLGDIDNDGDLDLLTASTSGSYVRVRRNRGNTAGADPGSYDEGTLVDVGHPAYGLVLGDVDGDGDLDLLTGSDSYGLVSVRLNGGDASGAGTGRFSGGSEVAMGSPPPVVSWPLSEAGKGVSSQPMPLNLVLGDVDGDGDLDLLATDNRGVGLVYIRLNGGDASGTNTGVFGRGEQVAVGSNPYGLALGDVDGDGDLDLLTVNWGGTVSVRLNGGDASGSGAGHFGSGAEVVVNQGAVGIALGDVDDDGDLDLVTSSFTTNRLSVRLNGGDATGSNTGRFGAGIEVPVDDQPQRLALADVDHDGDLDLLVACTGTGTVSVRLNGGDSTGSSTGRFGGGSNPAAGPAPVGLALADVDGDGDLDLLTSSPQGNQVSILLNHPWAMALTGMPTIGELLVQVYPNPTAQEQTLSIRTNQAGPATLRLADALGQPISQHELALSPGTTTLPLTTANDLTAGVYLLRVQQGRQQQTIRVVRR